MINYDDVHISKLYISQKFISIFSGLFIDETNLRVR
jgi:hypothetical protein